MATKTKTKQPTETAIVRAALKRVLSQIETAAKKAKTSLDLPEGSYPVSLKLQVEGDVNVAASAPAGDPVPTLKISQNALLHAMFVGRSRAECRRDIGKAMRLVKSAANKDSSRDQLKASGEQLAELLLSEGRKLDLVEDVTPSARAGAVTGKPSVAISGKAGSRSVSVEVKAA